jgi:GTP-binding protein Era
MTHKSGFVNIIGNPNVGKSTLMNELVGERLSIITSKSQTTRHRILGIVNGEDYQIVYSDTPGMLNPLYKLQESMMNFVHTALIDADVLIFMTDIYEQGVADERVLEKIKQSTVPVILLINKIDEATQEKIEERKTFWSKMIPNAELVTLSAKNKVNIDLVIGKIVELIPPGEPFYPKDQLTDKSERFFASEIIREKIFLNYKKEVPYSCEVSVETFKEEEKIIRMRAVISVARESQKGIIIGHQGAALKKVGIEARKQLEAFFQKQVHLELFVKVNKDWKDNPLQLKRFGYFE